MPDPIDELENFSTPGLTMDPLPASEVRRRGTRMRRRNNALATIGSVAAVALIATPIAVAANNGSSSPQPAPPIATQPAQGWAQQIPADFDLGELPSDATYAFTVRTDDSVVDDLTTCGVPAFSTRSADPAGPAVDVWGASYGEAGTESNAGRTLAVYADADQAQSALDGLREAVLACPTDEQGGNRSPLVNGEVDTPVPGADDAFVWTNQAQDGDLLYDLTAYEAVLVGNAVYLAETHTSAGGEQAMGTVDQLVSDSQPVVDRMCTFSADGC